MISILLVNDEPLVRQGLHMWLDSAPDVTVVGEVNSGAEAISLAQKLHPDVVLINLSRAPMDGFLATAALRTTQARSKVILLSLHDEAPIRNRAYAAGAAAFVGEQEGAHALLEAIRRVTKQEQVP